MPELPDICAYRVALAQRVVGHELSGIQLCKPFFLRSVEPPLNALTPSRVDDVSRIGKRLVFGLEGDGFLVLHLMIAGRLQWSDGTAPARKTRNTLAVFDFDNGRLAVTEAGTKKRASLHAVRGREALSAHDRGGLEVLESDPATFRERLRRENRTLKRALTDPRILSGIGNAYSDEILHAARLSPVTLTQKLDDDEIQRLYDAARDTLVSWRDRLVTAAQTSFPSKVTAFREGMAVHGRYRAPCPVCGTAVQRIRYASNETNYCPACQTGGRILADRSLSRLLKADWPKSVDELDAS